MIDNGHIEAAERSQPLCELELELVEGDPAELYALAQQLAETLPSPPRTSARPSAATACSPTTPCARPRPGRRGWPPSSRRSDAFRIIGFDCLALWQANESGARESDDPEFIHQLRVALRRLRSALRLFSPALPADFVSRWSDGLKEAADGLGAARDLDVMLAEVLSPVAESGLADEATQRLIAMAVDRRDREKTAAREQLLAASHGRQMLALAADLYGLQSDSLVKSANLTTFARLQLTQLRKRARKRYAAAADLHPDKLHELRVSLKRLRYAIEFLLPLLPEKATVRYANELAEIQDTLGYINDEAVARSRLKAWAGKDPELRSGAAFVAGWHAPDRPPAPQHPAHPRARAVGQVPLAAMNKSSPGNLPAPDSAPSIKKEETMDLLLWRHAEAVDGLPDSTRELTERGIKQAHKVAEWLEKRRPKKLRVLVSPTTRTRQTASAFTQNFEIVPALAPGNDISSILGACGWPDAGGSVLVVGHQPELGRLAALLLSGQEADWTIKKGALWWFTNRVRDDETQTVLRAVIPADLA
jgi:phosphohistidine phosphatase SixA